MCFVAGPDREVIRLHGCRHAQDYATWKELPKRTQPTEEYRQAYEAIGHKIEKRIEGVEGE